MSRLQRHLAALAEGALLSQGDAADAFHIVMSGGATPAQIGALLMALRLRGETVDELTGAARVLRSHAETLDAPPGAIDTCGTGGDHKGSWNISSAVAFVVAACGVPVAKHGNRSASSRSGAADVLQALGIHLEPDLAVVQRCLTEAGICFLFAARHHKAMRHVAPVRQELGLRTIFNLLGPLANPAGVKRQLLGVPSVQWLEPMAQVLRNLGSERAWVVTGSDGLDELTTTGPSHVAELRDGEIRCFNIAPGDAGLPLAEPAALVGGDPAENARALDRLLHGQPGAYRDIVVLNAAAALIVGGRAQTLAEGATLAADAIDNRDALKKLQLLRSMTHV